MSSVARFRALPTEDRVALVQAAALLLLARGLLVAPRVPIRRVVTTVAAVGRRLPSTPWARSAPTPDRLAWAVDVASTTLPVETTCLPRALAVGSLFARYGYDSTLRIGVARDDDGFAAHAWVERDGVVALGDLPDLERFVPLPLDDLSGTGWRSNWQG